MPAAKKKIQKQTEIAIDLPQMNRQTLILTLVGDSSLVMHRWSEKAKKMMLDKQMKKAKQAKEAKDPQQDFAESIYIFDEKPGDREKVKNLDFKGIRFGFPAVAFKAAAVGACRFADGVKMTEARGAFHVNLGEDLIEIEGTPKPREDMVRIAMGTADIRFRGEFKKWRAKIKVQYNASAMSAEQVTNLFNIAGFGVGVGEARPEKNGSWGMFHVATSEDTK